MKNTINVQGTINGTFNGNPISIENFSFTYETDANANEIATMISGAERLLNMFKPTIEKIVEPVTPATTKTTPATTTAKTTPTKDKDKDTMQVSWDLPAVWHVLEATMPRADFQVDHQVAGFKKDGPGVYKYHNPKTTDVSIRLAIREDAITLDIDSARFALNENPKYNIIIGINECVIPELIESIQDDETKKFVNDFIERLKK